MYQSSCTFLLKNTSKENTHGIPITTLSSQREILKIVFKLKAFIPFWPKWNKNCITTMKWNTCRPSDVFQENRSNVFPTLISVAALVHAILMRSIFISRHLTIHLRPRLTSEILHCKRNIYRCCCNDKMRIAY